MRLLYDRNALVKNAERLSKMGSFADTIGKLSLIADERNLARLINAFPEYFIEGQANLKVIEGGRKHYLLERQT